MSVYSDRMPRLPALDGLRAIAVGLVLLGHNVPESWFQAHTFGPGNAGVRLFFVLSGYLITGILLKAREEADASRQPMYQVWTAFYLRRALRIFPLAYAALLLAYLAGSDGVRENPWGYALYLENWLVVRDGIAAHWATSHFWSLAVEEQFYLAWPLLMLWLPRRYLLGMTVAMVIGAAVLRWFIGPHTLAAYMWTPTRMDALAWGAVLAQTTRLRPLDGVAAVALLPFTATMELGLVILSGAIVQGVIVGPAWVRTALSVRPLVYIGTISYGVYVLHWLIPIAVPVFPDIGLARFVTVSAVTILAAGASWRFFERPLNDLKRLVPYVRPARTQTRTYSSSSVAPLGR